MNRSYPVFHFPQSLAPNLLLGLKPTILSRSNTTMVHLLSFRTARSEPPRATPNAPPVLNAHNFSPARPSPKITAPSPSPRQHARLRPTSSPWHVCLRHQGTYRWRGPDHPSQAHPGPEGYQGSGMLIHTACVGVVCAKTYPVSVAPAGRGSGWQISVAPACRLRSPNRAAAAQDVMPLRLSLSAEEPAGNCCCGAVSYAAPNECTIAFV